MRQQPIDFDAVYAGLPPSDWHALKNAVLAAARPDEPAPEVPRHLQSHRVMELVRQFHISRDFRLLDEAARALCPLYPEKAWLALEKS